MNYLNVLCIHLTSYDSDIIAICILIVSVIISAVIATHKLWIQQMDDCFYKTIIKNQKDCTTVKDIFSIFKYLPGIIIIILMVFFVLSRIFSSLNNIWRIFQIINDILPICPILVGIFYGSKDILQKRVTFIQFVNVLYWLL